ncbi:MAG: tripartite tricarboxylate transporter TctB family protein [Deltaproteobacteria bacterium]|nr:tripartite tricarboxylate transporter TctB family protein [Deltaproteobacteria bacterium]
MRIKNQKDFVSGLMFLGIGLTFAFGAVLYDLGSASRMGPGYFPLLLGILLTLLGVAITFQSVVLKTGDGERIGAWAWRPLVCILGANFVFGILLTGSPALKLPAMGVILGIYVLTIIASLASRQFKIREVLILATVLAVGSFLIFVVLLKLQIPAWPFFITG